MQLKCGIRVLGTTQKMLRLNVNIHRVNIETLPTVNWGVKHIVNFILYQRFVAINKQKSPLFPVASGSWKECQASHLLKLTSPNGYIASTRTEEEGLGSIQCPWYIRVKAGQRIRVTLLSFVDTPAGHGNLVNENQLSRRQENCYDLAEVIEGSLKKPIRVCLGEPREKTVLVSNSNQIKVVIERRKLLSSLGAFLLKYEGKNGV